MEHTDWAPFGAGVLGMAAIAALGASSPAGAWLAVAIAAALAGYLHGVVVQQALGRPAPWRPLPPAFYLPCLLLGGACLAGLAAGGLLERLLWPDRAVDVVASAFPLVLTGGAATFVAILALFAMLGALYGFHLLADGQGPRAAYQASMASAERRRLLGLLILPLPLWSLIDPGFSNETLLVWGPAELGQAAGLAAAATVPLTWLLARHFRRLALPPAPPRFAAAGKLLTPVLGVGVGLAIWQGGAFSHGDAAPAVQGGVTYTIATVATDQGWGPLSGPWGLAAAPDGTLYLAEPAANRILAKAPGKPVTVLAQGNPALGHRGLQLDPLGRPRELAVGPGGTLFSTSYVQAAVMATTAGRPPALVAGGWHGRFDGVGPAAHFNTPAGLAFDPHGNLYVADDANNRIRRIGQDGQVTTYAGGRVGLADGPARAARFSYPQGLAADRAGNLYVADTGNHAIRKLAPDGTVSTLAGLPGGGLQDGAFAAARFADPVGLALDARGDLYVVESGAGRLRKLGTDGQVTTLIDGQGGLSNPVGVAVGPDGAVYVADYGHARVVVVRERG